MPSIDNLGPLQRVERVVDLRRDYPGCPPGEQTERLHRCWSMHDPGGEAWWPERLRPMP